jgi:hypothetical protein
VKELHKSPPKPLPSREGYNYIVSSPLRERVRERG